MLVIAVLVGIAAALFCAAFFSKRRFGLLGLALTAGATLSTLWSYDAGLIVSSTGLVPDGPITNAVSLAVVVLLPAILLLFHGYTYKNMFGRVIGSLLFTVLALAFLTEPIGSIFALSGVSQEVFNFIVSHKNTIISVGVVFAIIDLFFTKPPSKKERERHR